MATRSNLFVVRPCTEQHEQLLRELLDASASLWNELTYERRQNFFNGKSVWDTTDYRKKYKGTVGSAIAQQLIANNDKAWNSFFALNEKYNAGKLDTRPSPPGYRGNEEDGRELKTSIRNDMYTLVTGERSRLEIPVGQDLKDKYGLGYHDRLRLEVTGHPKWDGKQRALELQYDDFADRYRAYQPVKIDTSRLDSPLASEEAALDIGANNLVACTTTTGSQYLYEGRDLFKKFHETIREIARLQSKLPEGRYTSNRIQSLFRCYDWRNHAQDALVRQLIEQLYDEGVSTLYVGALTDVLETHWSVETNLKTHNFWAFRRFIDRVKHTAEEYGIEVVERSEAWTSQTCPNCGSTEDTIRHEDSLACSCGFEGHADLVASESFLRRNATIAVTRPMARPVRFEWDDHDWSGSPRPHESPEEARTNRSTS